LGPEKPCLKLIIVHGRAQSNFPLLKDLWPRFRRVFTAVHREQRALILFTWELRDRAKQKRWFYINLKRILEELPPKNWSKVGGSVYLLDDRYSHKLRKLLRRFEGPELKWYEFKSKSNRIALRAMHGRAQRRPLQKIAKVRS
jgi:hypothetical protein